jgi:hypothetical protein
MDWEHVRDVQHTTRDLAVGDEHASDAGRGWKRLLATGAHTARSVSFAGARHGFLDVSVPYSETPSEGPSPGQGVLLRTSDGGRTWHRQYLGGNAEIYAVLATGRASAVASAEGDLIWTRSGGEGQQRSRITLRAQRTRMSRPGRVRLRGRVSPPQAGTIELSRFSRSAGWDSREVRVGVDGRFQAVRPISRTSWFVAQSDATRERRGAGTPAIKVVVR